MLEKIIILLILSALSFILALLATPLLTRCLIRFRWWKKQARTQSADGTATPLFHALHKEKEISTPRSAGVLIWGTVLFLTIFIWLLNQFWPAQFASFNFISRSQTWIPLFTLFTASLLGLLDDAGVVLGFGEKAAKGGGIRFRHRLLVILLISLIGAYWFYFKLEWNTIHIPFWGDAVLGWWYIPLFVFVMIGFFSGSVIDGIDGLAGGVFAVLFGAFAAIAFMRGQYDLAIFCGLVAGATSAFLWNNIPPARFYMGETGIFGLTTTLAVVAFFTDSVLLLPVIAIVLLAEIASVALQLVSKKFLGRKIFLIAPLHHHFEAKGWPAFQVTMRFWLVSIIAALLGLIIFLADKIYL